MIQRSTLFTMTVALLGSGVLACSDSGTFTPEEPAILSITIVNPCGVLEAGDTCTMSARAFIEGGIEERNPDLLWSSSRPTVLTVEGQGTQGVLRGVRGGDATITVSARDNPQVRTQAEVTVVPIPPQGPGGQPL